MENQEGSRAVFTNWQTTLNCLPLPYMTTNIYHPLYLLPSDLLLFSLLFLEVWVPWYAPPLRYGQCTPSFSTRQIFYWNLLPFLLVLLVLLISHELLILFILPILHAPVISTHSNHSIHPTHSTHSTRPTHPIYIPILLVLFSLPILPAPVISTHSNHSIHSTHSTHCSHCTDSTHSTRSTYSTRSACIIIDHTHI